MCSDPRDPFGFSTCQNETHTVEEIKSVSNTLFHDARALLGKPLSWQIRCRVGSLGCTDGCSSYRKYCDIIDVVPRSRAPEPSLPRVWPDVTCVLVQTEDTSLNLVVGVAWPVRDPGLPLCQTCSVAVRLRPD